MKIAEVYEEIIKALPDTITEGHATIGRKLVRSRAFSARELAVQWRCDLVGLHAALLGTIFPEIADPAPLTPGEILAAEGVISPSVQRNSPKKIIDPTMALTPIEDEDHNALCGVPGCGRPHLAYGFCDPHFKRMLRTGNAQVDTPIVTRRKVGASVPLCAVEGCGNPVIIRHETYVEYGVGGKCRRCYRQAQEAAQRERDTRREVTFL